MKISMVIFLERLLEPLRRKRKNKGKGKLRSSKDVRREIAVNLINEGFTPVEVIKITGMGKTQLYNILKKGGYAKSYVYLKKKEIFEEI